MEILISIIIPVKNGAKTIEKCLDAIKSQTIFDKTETIIIDSGSTDGTLDIIKKYEFVNLYQIPPVEFGHGKTRNYGVSLAKGEFVVMTVQDARPASDNWLEIMLQHFTDELVAGVCGQQVVPHEKDKNPLEWFRPVSVPSFNIKYFPQNKFAGLSSEEQWQNCRWDDVNAMYRKTVLEKIPFQNVEFGEDMIWAKDALLTGFKIVYDSHSQVFHYHHNTDNILLKQRIESTLFFTYKTFKVKRKNPHNLKSFIRMIYMLVKFNAVPKWWFYNIRVFIVSLKTHKGFKFD